MKRSSYVVWIHEKVSLQLRTFSNEPILIEGKIKTPVTSNGWASKLATFTVVADGLKSLIGRELFVHPGLAVTQSSSSQGNHVNSISSSSLFKEHIAQNFPNLISRISKSKHHVSKSNFHKDFQLTHQKSRRIPINLQDKSIKRLKKLLDEKHIIKLSSCPDKCFISPIVDTVKKDQTIKHALDSKIQNRAIQRNKYQMPNIDTPIESISLQISAPAP